MTGAGTRIELSEQQRSTSLAASPVPYIMMSLRPATKHGRKMTCVPVTWNSGTLRRMMWSLGGSAVGSSNAPIAQFSACMFTALVIPLPKTGQRRTHVGRPHGQADATRLESTTCRPYAPVGQHDALGVRGRARGVHNFRDVVGFNHHCQHTRRPPQMSHAANTENRVQDDVCIPERGFPAAAARTPAKVWTPSGSLPSPLRVCVSGNNANRSSSSVVAGSH